MKTSVPLQACQIDGEGARGGARAGAGRPEALTPKTAYSLRLEDTTVERIERFAKARKLNRTQALETMVEEYQLVLDQVILPPRWEGNKYPRPGLKTMRPAGPRVTRPDSKKLQARHAGLWPNSAE